MYRITFVPKSKGIAFLPFLFYNQETIIFILSIFPAVSANFQNKQMTENAKNAPHFKKGVL